MKVEPVAVARPPFVYWTCLWVSGVAFALVALTYDVIRHNLFMPIGRDFSNLYVAGQLALEGKAWLAFDPNSFRIEILERIGSLTTQNYSYPPHALFIAVPFALLPYGASLALFSAIGFGLFVWAARPYVGFPAILAAITPAACLNLWNGHYGLILGALWLIYFRNLETRPIRSGLAAAALTFKPHMGPFIAITAMGRPKVLPPAIMGALGLFALSTAVFGLACWYGFIGATTREQAVILARHSGEFYFLLMPSAYTVYGRNSWSLLAQLLVAGAAIAMLWRNWRVDPFTLATATFLIVPYVFVYDMTVACLGIAVLLWRDWPVLPLWQRVILTAAFFAPAINMVFAAAVPPILLGALYAQCKSSPVGSAVHRPADRFGFLGDREFLRRA